MKKPLDWYGNHHTLYGDTFDELFYFVVKKLMKNYEYECAPRGQKIRECIAQTLVLERPRARLLTYDARNANYGFATGEFLWYWRAADDLDSMLYYNRRMGDFSDDGLTLNSAYGKRIKTYRGMNPQRFKGPDDHEFSQWDVCRRTLINDSDSRRAIVLINEPFDQLRALTIGSKDVPCTLSMQFFIRDNCLDMHVHMRSNDVVWGLTNDLYSFTLMQECMLLELKREKKFKDLDLGRYYHTAGSLHIYERHFDMATSIIKEHDEYSNLVHGVDKCDMGSIEIEDINTLLIIEDDLRNGFSYNEEPFMVSDGGKFMLRKLMEHRRKRDDEEYNR